MQFADLLTRLSYLPPKDIEVLSRAYDAAASAHHDQNRLSGEKFIEHPLSVAAILADLQLDRDTLAAAILHDTVEDTHLTVSDLEQSFGPTVGKLVAGVTKLEKLSFHSPEQAQAENVRKMLVAMAEDVRVVLMKLADRLHNMRTVESLPEVRRRAMAQETLDIYAPLAHRLGMWNIKWELEDLSFAQLHRDAEVERLPVAAYHRGQPQRRADGDPDSHPGDAPHGGVGRGGPLDLQRGRQGRPQDGPALRLAASVDGLAEGSARRREVRRRREGRRLSGRGVRLYPERGRARPANGRDGRGFCLPDPH